MKRQRQAVGLIVEGSATQSALLRLPQVADALGPVKSTVLRVARRFSNFIRAGYAVSTYEELQESRLILVRVPDVAVPRVVNEICASGLDLNDMSVALCETWLTIDALAALADRGAGTATLIGVPGSRRQFFILEGDSAPIRQLRHLIEHDDTRAFAIRPGAKCLYFAAELLAAVFPLPLLAAAQAALRHAGISGNHVRAVIDEMAHTALKDFSRSSRAGSGGVLNACAAELREAHLSALRRTEPQVASLVDEQIVAGRSSARVGLRRAKYIL